MFLCLFVRVFVAVVWIGIILCGGSGGGEDVSNSHDDGDGVDVKW